MNAQSAAAPLREYREISARLSGFDHTESVFLPGDGEIHGVVTGDLQEDAAVGAALVGLPRGMKETGAEAQAGGYFLGVADGVADVLQGLFVVGVHWELAQNREVVARTKAREVSHEDIGQGFAAGHRRGIFRIRKKLG